MKYLVVLPVCVCVCVRVCVRVRVRARVCVCLRARVFASFVSNNLLLMRQETFSLPSCFD